MVRSNLIFSPFNAKLFYPLLLVSALSGHCMAAGTAEQLDSDHAIITLSGADAVSLEKLISPLLKDKTGTDLFKCERKSDLVCTVFSDFVFTKDPEGRIGIKTEPLNVVLYRALKGNPLTRVEDTGYGDTKYSFENKITCIHRGGIAESGDNCFFDTTTKVDLQCRIGKKIVHEKKFANLTYCNSNSN